MNITTSESSNLTAVDYLRKWSREHGDRIWLRERKGDEFNEWSWRQAEEQVDALAAWLEQRYGSDNTIVILSRNCAHWYLADMAISASGNRCTPMFTTQNADVARYMIDFTEVKALFLGEAENWEKVREVVPDHVDIITFPGVDEVRSSFNWQQQLTSYRGQKPVYGGKPDDVFLYIFTSDTTGMPKAVMWTHDLAFEQMKNVSNLQRFPEFGSYLSYLPAAHSAERVGPWGSSLYTCGTVTFNESPVTLPRDIQESSPSYFGAVPRVWEQLSQLLLAAFGGQEAFDQALKEDEKAAIAKAHSILGLYPNSVLISGTAPISVALFNWFEQLDLVISEGYGSTEAGVSIMSTRQDRRIGSIGKPLPGTELKISDEGELLLRSHSMTPGYYKMPEKTAETIVDGWLHTGDQARVDEDGFYYITGRVKDYFKTIHGKFVAPVPIENSFGANPLLQQPCLIGRGYSKTALVCVLSPEAQNHARDAIAASVKMTAEEINRTVEKHARVGVIIIEQDPWCIDNDMMTVTLKVKRDQVENRYGKIAEPLARRAAEEGEILVEFA